MESFEPNTNLAEATPVRASQRSNPFPVARGWIGDVFLFVAVIALGCAGCATRPGHVAPQVYGRSRTNFNAAHGATYTADNIRAAQSQGVPVSLDAALGALSGDIARSGRPSPEHWRIVEAAFTGANREQRMVAAENMVSIYRTPERSEALGYVRKMLNSSDPREREAALFGCSELLPDDLPQILAKGKHDPSAEVRQVADNLDRYHAPLGESVPEENLRIARESGVPVRLVVTMASLSRDVARLGHVSPEHWQTVKTALSSGSKSDRIFAARGLRIIGNTPHRAEALGYVRKMLTSDYPIERVVALMGCYVLRADDLARILDQAKSDPSPDVRAFAERLDHIRTGSTFKAHLEP